MYSTEVLQVEPRVKLAGVGNFSTTQKKAALGPW